MSKSDTLNIPEKTPTHPRYDAYKDSSVEWLGEIPEHWRVKRLKRTVTGCKNGYWGDTPEGDESDLPVIRVADFDRFGLRIPEQEFTVRSVPENKRNGRLLKEGDLLLEKSGGGEKQPVGAVVLYDLDLEAVSSNFIGRMRVKDAYSSSFLRYVHAMLYGLGVNERAIKQSIGIQNLDADYYLRTKVPTPPLPEQRAIAAYLDRETERIDALVAKKERLIELLEEKRTALISHAVTKGLDDAAEMKDSGVEWLGEIPAGWDVVKFSHYFSITQGQVDPRDEEYEDRMLLAPNHIESHTGRISELETAREQGAISGKYVVQEGDIVYSKIRPELNKVCIAEGDWLCSADMYPIKVDKGFESRYLKYFLLSQPFCHRMVNESMRVAMPKVNRDTLSSTEIIKPPREVQRNIVRIIENSIVRIDTLTDKVRDGIDQLKEYRTALISAAVTGQIDVRDQV